MKNRVLIVMAVSMCGIAALHVSADTAPQTQPATQAAPSDSLLAEELTRLKQAEMLHAEAAAAKDAPAAHLWRAGEMMLHWNVTGKSDAAIQAMGQAYLTEINAYLDSPAGATADAGWAAEQAKFVMGKVAEPAVSRAEYWGATPADRRELAPAGKTGMRLVKVAQTSAAAGMAAADGPGGFDEPRYTRNYAASAEASYYEAWATYVQALAADPAQPGRKELFLAAAAALSKWADDANDNGVNKQALLLRGKAWSEAGETEKAAADFQRLDMPGTPAWMREQARYQAVVALMCGPNPTATQDALAAFEKNTNEANNDQAISAAILKYRIAWTSAKDSASQAAAMTILENLARRDPRYQELIYAHIAAESEGQTKNLLPLQSLAQAYVAALGQTGDYPDSRAKLQAATTAAQAVRNNDQASPDEKSQATLLAAVCEGRLGNLVNAAALNEAFAEMSPADPRAKAMLDLALEQIGQLKKISGAEELTPDLRALQERALLLATGTFKDERWRFALARALEQNEKSDQAAAAYAAVRSEDANYLDAQYRLVALATQHFSKVAAAGDAAATKSASDTLFAACQHFSDTLDHPPFGVDTAALDRAKTYRIDVWLIETSVALDPAVRASAIALDRLAKLERMKAQLTPEQQGTILRYRIQAYELAGEADKALQVVKAYAKSEGKDATAVIQSMAASALTEITAVEKTDSPRAKHLADFLAELLKALVKANDSAGDANAKTQTYALEKLEADMLVRAGRSAESQTLALKLEGEAPADLFNFMTEARAIFAQGQQANDPKAYAQAEDLFGRILPKVTNGGDTFWECWLRIIEAKEALGGLQAAPDIKQRLSDLRAVYGDKLGGDAFKSEFAALTTKYGT